MTHDPGCVWCRAVVCVPATIAGGVAVDLWFIRGGHLSASNHAGIHRLATVGALGFFAWHFFSSGPFDPLAWLCDQFHPTERGNPCGFSSCS